MAACSGIFGRAYEVFVPPCVNKAAFPRLISTIKRAVGEETSVTCKCHEGPFDPDDELMKTVIGIAMENVPEGEMMSDSHQRAGTAVFLALGRTLRVKFTDPAGSVVCNLVPS